MLGIVGTIPEEDVGIVPGVPELLGDEIAVSAMRFYELDTLTFHYLLPDLDWYNRVLLEIEGIKRPPTLLADAGYMYVAKVSGCPDEYHFFSPDVGELAFLADEEAPHPFYTRGFRLHKAEMVLQMGSRAILTKCLPMVAGERQDGLYGF